MQYKLLSLAALAATAVAQNMSLTSVIASNPNLSNLTSFASFFPASLMNATNITVLAPSNEAFAALNASGVLAMAASNPTVIQDLLSYHILNGTYQSTMITSNATFIPTMLTDPAYSNVTGGQRVEAVMVGQNVSIFSGLLSNATVTQAVSPLNYEASGAGPC